MLLRVLFFVVLATSLATAQNTGRITGTVLDDHGRVVESATVCLSTQLKGDSSSSNCLVPADHGQFQIHNIGFGTYGVFAINEEEGYSIANQSPGQKVTVSAANQSPDITVRLRPGGAVLSGTVRDKSNGKSIKGFTVQYLDVDGKASGSGPFGRDGELHVVLPPDCDLVIVVSANGYKGWAYTDPSNASRPMLRLAAGERKQLDIELEPKSAE